MYLVCASVCYRGYKEDEVAAMLEDAPKAGYEYVDIHGPMTWSPEAIDDFDVEAMKARIQAAGLKCAGLYPPGFGGVDDEDVSIHARAIAKATEIAGQFGADYIDTTGATKRGEGNLDRVIDCLKQILDLTPKSQVKLALENHLGNVLERQEDYGKVLSVIDHPRVGICVDTGHFHSAGVDTVSLIRKFGPRVYAVHVKDHVGKQSVGIGRGEIDLKAIINTLKEVGFQGPLIVELEHKDKENTLQYVREAKTYLEKLL